MENKQILTAEIVAKTIDRNNVSGNKLWGRIFCVIGALLLIIGVSDPEGFGPQLFFVGCVLLFFGIRFNKAFKRNMANFQAGNYQVIKTLCTGYTDESDGEYTGYATHFENGAHIYNTQPLGERGDTFYLVYLDGVKDPVQIYSGKDYVPSEDLPTVDYSSHNPMY